MGIQEDIKRIENLNSTPLALLIREALSKNYSEETVEALLSAAHYVDHQLAERFILKYECDASSSGPVYVTMRASNHRRVCMIFYENGSLGVDARAPHLRVDVKYTPMPRKRIMSIEWIIEEVIRPEVVR